MDECHETPTGWHLTLWCSVCYVVSERTVTQEQADRYDEHLDDQRREVVRSLENLERLHAKDDRKRFEREAERFIRAIQGGHILPEDFH